MTAKRPPVGIAPLVVGVAEAAFLLNTSQDKVHELLAGGYLNTVPNLSSPRKIAIAVAELERFAAVNVVRPRHLAAVADAGQIDVDRVLMIVGAFALGVVAALSPLAVTVYVALIAVCAFAASWLVVHELRDRGHLRDPYRDRVLADPAALPGPCSRVEVRNLDHIVVPGPFSRAGTRK